MTAITQSDYDRAPCLRGGPIADGARELITVARALGKSPWATTLRAWCVPHLFHVQEVTLAQGVEPFQAFNRALADATKTLRVAAASDFDPLLKARGVGVGSAAAEPTQNVERVTGEHYGRLFEKFSPASYWDEPKRLLSERLERNDITIANLDQKEVLDGGCGGGRYTVAWRLLGAKACVGFDYSDVGLQDARERVRVAGIQNVTYEQGNVLELPYPDQRFDIVFSNGVLHHTRDWRKGIQELVRVLKPGGFGWLYLIENPGGLFWDMVEILRVVTFGDDREIARGALRQLGMPANRVFYMLDHVMAPINDRLTSEQIETALREAGAKNIRRLTRGTDFDRVEAIYQKKPYATEHFGAGENRHVFTK